VPEDWWYFPVVARLHNERTGYPTQKPETLLERVIKASSNKGELVADFFSGSGTTATVASRLGRKFIAVDESWRALHTTRKRLTDQKAVFTLEHVPTYPVSAKESSKITARAKGDLISLVSSLDVDYWEVDPRWDGKVFQSAMQISAPLRGGEIPMQVKIKDRRKTCLRVVTVKGDLYQIEVG
jgi:hypothetical protein